MLFLSNGNHVTFFRLNSHHFHQFSMQNLTLLLTDNTFTLRKPTIMYVSGWMLSPSGETSVQLIDAYLKYQDCNLLLLDWSEYSVGLYTPVMFRISTIARIVGRHLTKLFGNGLNDKMFHCVGHSFGGIKNFIDLQKFQFSSKSKF